MIGSETLSYRENYKALVRGRGVEMETTPEKARDIVIDIKTSTVSTDISKEAGAPILSADKIGIIVPFLDGNLSSFSSDGGNHNKREKHKSWSTKNKSPKPPRPPGRLLLDAADQKLIKEISELVRIKRARIERMKALKRMKEANASSSSSISSSGNLIPIFFVVLFCIVVIFQGCHSSGSSPRIRSAIHVHGPLESNGKLQENLATTPNDMQRFLIPMARERSGR